MDDPYGAFCGDGDIALAGASDGPLAGLNFAVKDIFDIAGYRTGFGNPTWRETHPPAERTASAVCRLLDAGADMAGENVHYGTPVNPAAPDRVPGGSSNGSVSAVSGGLVDFALGTDCGGSVRLPASYCGILGMRPSLGRIPMDGIIPFSASFDVVGWFARDAGLLECVGRVLLADAGPAPAPQRLVIADDAFALVEDRVGDVLGPAVAQAGAIVGETRHATVSPDGLAEWFSVFRVIQASEIWANHGTWINKAKPNFGRGIRERMDWAREVKAGDVARCRREHARIRTRLDELLEPGDVLCLPTSPRVAPPKNAPTDDIEVHYRHQAMCLLCISGLGGLPQISLPLGQLDGLPLGLSFIARRGDDLMLLDLARRLMKGLD